jgi:cyclohexanone monooxygenase
MPSISRIVSPEHLQQNAMGRLPDSAPRDSRSENKAKVYLDHPPSMEASLEDAGEPQRHRHDCLKLLRNLSAGLRWPRASANDDTCFVSITLLFPSSPFPYNRRLETSSRIKMVKQHHFDALIVGAGFGGIYQLYRLRELGLSTIVIDAAGDVGGTWYWNQYPGAMSDTESYIYRYSWDKEDLLKYPWKEHYVKQPEVLAYLNHVVDRFDLRKNMQFNTELKDAQWDEDSHRWIIKTSTGEEFRARYLVTALGLLSKTNFPAYPGIDTFKGEMYHTGKWPKSHDFTNKRVGVVGNGSTGVQVITALGSRVKELLCFQRTPQYSVPSGDGPVAPEYREKVNAQYESIWRQVRQSQVAFGFKESTTSAKSVSPEEREAVFEKAWQLGNGFRFMFWTFNDLTVDPEANEFACEFIRKKIRQTVKDPEKARKLCPTDFYARRPLCDGGYYEQFNRDNVNIVDLKSDPIVEFTPTGIKTTNKSTGESTTHELDVIVFATGFDAVDGNYTRIAIKGRNGDSLRDHWQESGPTTYLGISVPDFPNLFMITGPNGPFTNIPPTIETHVEFITELIAQSEKSRSLASPDNQDGIVVEATSEAEEQWTDLCKQLSDNSLFKITDSWIFGANVPGKKNAVMFYFGGLGNYRKKLEEVRVNGYQGFREGLATGDGRKNEAVRIEPSVEATMPSVEAARI